MYIFGDFMCSNEAINETKLDKLYCFNIFLLIIQCYVYHKSREHNDCNVNE
jgi:hypothetical protein